MSVPTGKFANQGKPLEQYIVGLSLRDRHFGYDAEIRVSERLDYALPELRRACSRLQTLAIAISYSAYSS